MCSLASCTRDMRLVTLLYSFLLSWSWTFIVILRRCFAPSFPFFHASSQSFFAVWLMILDLKDLSGLWMKLASPVFDFAASFAALSAFSLPAIVVDDNHHHNSSLFSHFKQNAHGE